MKRLLASMAALVVLLIAAPAWGAETHFVVSAGPHTAHRTDPGIAVLTVEATNLSAYELRLTLRPDRDACAGAVGEPDLQPYTTGDVTFTLECDGDPVPRGATVTAAFLGSAGAPTPAAVPLRLDVVPSPHPQWAVLWWFLAAVPVAAVGVLVPYLFWCRSPAGNVVPGVPAPAAKDWRDFGRRLPGISADWNLKDNWSSNVGLAAALFTTVVADADPLRQLLGSDSTGPLAVVTIAAALSAALIGTGPLWLVVFKRRYLHSPAARNNTVAGVLAAAFVVLCASLGLVVTVAVLLQRVPVWLLALAATGLLLAYSAKSIPMTLARGTLDRTDAEHRASGMP